MYKPRAFTLVEILVVISIIGLILVLSIPLVNNAQKSSILRNEARQMATDLRYAQQLAVTEQIIYNVVFSTSTNSYQIINSVTSEVIKTSDINQEVSIDDVTGFTNETVQYNASGAVITIGEIKLLNTKNESSTVELKPSGYVQINN